jgi:hypothetical protein
VAPAVPSRFGAFYKEKRPPTLGGLVKEKENSHVLRHRGAAHKPNSIIAVGTLI